MRSLTFGCRWRNIRSEEHSHVRRHAHESFVQQILLFVRFQASACMVCACVRACLCVCLHVGMRVWECMCVCMCARVCVCMCARVCMHVCVCVCAHACMHMRVCAYVRMCMHESLCSHIHHSLKQLKMEHKILPLGLVTTIHVEGKGTWSKSTTLVSLSS